MNKKYTFATIIAAALLAFAVSCKKDNSGTSSSSSGSSSTTSGSSTSGSTTSGALATSTAEDNAICDNIFTQTASGSNSFTIQEQGVKKSHGTCPSIIPSDTTIIAWPRSYTIDFGSAGCVDPRDGKTKKGQIKLSYTKRWSSSGSILTVTYTGYSVNGITLDGTVTLTQGGNNFIYSVKNGRCSGAGWQLQWECSRIVTMINGKNTPDDPSDDVYSITGTASGVNKSGTSYSISINSLKPVIVTASCGWITSGTITLTQQGQPDKVLDYGSGTCDNDASVTISGTLYPFKM